MLALRLRLMLVGSFGFGLGRCGFFELSAVGVSGSNLLKFASLGQECFWLHEFGG